MLALSLGQPEAFGELYARHFAAVYRYVAGRLGPDAADDLAAETFLAAFRRRHRFDPARGAVRPWLFGIATNLVAQHHRAESRWYAALARAGSDPLIAPAVWADDEDRIADPVVAAQARPALAAVLARLPDRDRDVLLLVAVGGLSYAEAAFDDSPGRRIGIVATAISVAAAAAAATTLTLVHPGSAPPSAAQRGNTPRHGKVVNDHAAVDGRRAIEISDSGNPTLSVLLWVDAQTYLPLRQVKLDWGATNNPETRKVYDYQFLPATPANLTTLTLSVPSGYKKASS